MTEQKTTRSKEKQQQAVKKCAFDGNVKFSQCTRPEWLVVRDEGPLFGTQKYASCGGSWTWGD